MRFFRILFFWAHLCIVGILAAMLFNAVVSPKVFPYFNLIPLGFPVLLLMHILLCVFWIFSLKKRAILFVLFSLLMINPAKRWINFSSKPKEVSNLKILTFNTHTGYSDFKKISEYIEQEKPDIAILQEVAANADVPFYKNQIKNQPIIYLGTNFKILNSGRVDNGGSNGNCLFADVEIRGKVVRIVNVYLNPFSLDKNTLRPDSDISDDDKKAKYLINKMIPIFKVHQLEMEKISEFIKNSPYPVIMAGDFNSVPNTYEYYTAAGVLDDVFLRVGNGSATSFHDYKYPIRIDYVFASKSLKPISYKVDRSVHVSDHFPVLAEFKVD